MNSHGLDGFNQDIRKCEGSYSIRDRYCRLLSGSGFACNSTGTLETSSFGDNCVHTAEIRLATTINHLGSCLNVIRCLRSHFK